MFTPIEDLGFSHDVEQNDGEWDGFETVHAKLTAQWYADPNDPEWGWNVERPGYVLREREVFLDGFCFLKLRRDNNCVPAFVGGVGGNRNRYLPS